MKAMNGVGEDFSTKGNGDRTPPILSHAFIGTITYYLSLTLCVQLGSSNQSALFIHCHY